MNPTLKDLTAEQALPSLRRGSLSVRDYALGLMDRIEIRDGEVKAWSVVDRDVVLAQADLLDALPEASRGPLHGLPIGIKDVILTRDLPTRYNSELYKDALPLEDASCVAVLRSAGALILGKTDTVEFAATGRPAATRNPHDLTRTPGGSSSGSAAAVADRHCPVSLGTQTGGSIIRPASYCGVFGFKPTWGLVDRGGVKAFAPSLDTIGWFSRSAADLGLIHGLFDIEPGSHAAPLDLRDARVGLCLTPFWEQADEDARAAVETAKDRLQAAGASVEAFDLPDDFDEMVHLQSLIMFGEARASFLAEYRAHPDRLGPSFRDHVENARGITRRQLCHAYDRAADCRRIFDDLASSYDAILAPSTVGAAPQGLTQTGSYVFNTLWTLLHVPVVNVPGLKTAAGLPIGLSLVGARFDDRAVLRAAAAFGDLFAA